MLNNDFGFYLVVGAIFGLLICAYANDDIELAIYVAKTPSADAPPKAQMIDDGFLAHPAAHAVLTLLGLRAAPIG